MRKRPTAANDGFDEWGGYMDAKKSKLEEQFAQDALKNPYKESDLFAGISIFVNGLTNPSADELKRIMMKNGGVYHTYQRSSTTFVIATNLPDVKIRQITSAKIISPQWVVDCLTQQRILDYSKYLLYTSCKTSQPKISFASGDKNILHDLDFLNTAIRNQDILSPQNESKKEHREDNPAKNEVKKNMARTAVDPNFLSEFYNNSRLHHIATLGAGFKTHVSKLRESHNGLFPARDALQREKLDFEMEKNPNAIMHIDMDCFFVSVGLRSRPHLRGRPIAVTHSKGNAPNSLRANIGADPKKEMELYIKKRYKTDHSSSSINEKVPMIDPTVSLSEIASCSYEARKMGVKNGMFIGAAIKLCPDLVTIPYEFDAYKEVAFSLYDTITQYTLEIEAVSCDEMYVNLTDVLKHTNLSVDEFVSIIRNEITERTGCPCSAGVGANKLQARMATKKAKPNGQFHLLSDEVEEFFTDIPISDLPGVGHSSNYKLKNFNLKTCEDLRSWSLIRLEHEFGKKLGLSLYNHCRGIDDKPLVYDQIRKSVSAEVNYGIRFTEMYELDNFLRQLCTEVHSRLKEIDSKGKTITLKYMVRAEEAPVETAKFMGHGFCDKVTKSITLASTTDDVSIITSTIFGIKSALNVTPEELRGIGIQISKLETLTVIESKSNTLKMLFNKAIEKNNQINENRIVESVQDKKVSSLRKTKSFDIGSSSRNISQLFMGMKEKNELKSKDDTNSLMEEIDLSVLDNLPSEIREEILRDQNVLRKNLEVAGSRKSTARKIENDFIDKPSKPVMKVSEENILAISDWRAILINWIESTDEPVDYDTNVIVGYFVEFLNDGRLSEIHLTLRFLHRKIGETLNCKWHSVYFTILNAVQNHMIVTFGDNSSLLAEEYFDCKNCKDVKNLFTY